MIPWSYVMLAIVVMMGTLTWHQSRFATVGAIALAFVVGNGPEVGASLRLLLGVGGVALAASLYWYGSIARQRTFSPDTDVMEPRDPSVHQSTPAIDAYFERQGALLAQAAFTASVDLVEVTRSELASTLTFLRHYTSAETWVTLACIVGRQGEVEVEQPPIIVCSTMMPGDVHLVTTNLQGLDALPSPRERRANLPDIANVPSLLRVHRARVTQAGDVPIHRPVPDDWIAVTRSFRRNLYEYHADRGWMDRIGSTGFRLTTSGAMRFVFLSALALRPVHQWIARRRQKQLLESLGMSDLPMEQHAHKPAFKLRSLVPATGLTLSLIALLAWFPDILWSRSTAGGALSEGATLTVPADLVVPDSFAGAIAVLERVAGRNAEPLAVHPDVRPAVDIRVVQLPLADAHLLVERARDAFAAQGFLLFHTTHYGDQYRVGVDAVAIAATLDPFLVMRQVGTNGDNYDVSTDSIIGWFRETQRELPLRFTSIAFDFVGATIERSVTDQRALGVRYMAFCPGAREFGVNARRAGRDLAKERYLYCWWD
jgi:hypothetical protein